MNHISVDKKTVCYHCGDLCSKNTIMKDDKVFCCNGCKMLYELLSENELYTYYDLESSPGKNFDTPLFKEKFSYLDDESVAEQLKEFNDGGISKVTFFIPSIHCSSCIWLLEKLYRLSSAVTSSRVNFVKKQILRIFKHR